MGSCQEGGWGEDVGGREGDLSRGVMSMHIQCSGVEAYLSLRWTVRKVRPTPAAAVP